LNQEKAYKRPHETCESCDRSKHRPKVGSTEERESCSGLRLGKGGKKPFTGEALEIRKGREKVSASPF